jgi:long-chain acyl-CoA synthetase
MGTNLKEAEETIVTALPLYHIYCLTVNCLTFMKIGGENLLITNPRDMPGFVKELAGHRFTVLSGVNTLFNGLLNTPGFDKLDFSRLKLCTGGGAAVQRAVAERWQKVTGTHLVEGYGLTETSPFTHCTPLFGERRAVSIGLPLPDTEARVVDLVSGEPLLPGEEGELEVRGPQVMLGYWGRPEESAEAFHDGWLRTGDVARMDPDGFFHVVDRRKDMIDASGFKVLPREVEEVLFMHPKVREAVVAVVPDAYRGETVKAFVVLKPGEAASEEEIVEFCRLHLAAYKIPRRVEFRETLPKSMVGKYLRRVLVEEERTAAR